MQFHGLWAKGRSLCWLLVCWGMLAGSALAGGPSFDCAKVEAGSIEAMICADQELIRLDRQLAQTYREAGNKAVNEHPPVLRAEQRGWVKGRNDCWKSADTRQCVADSYRLRIAELQARYRLVAAIGPVTYRCDDQPGSEVVATYFQTEPGTLIAERGDQVSLMFQQVSASGARYQGRNESLWEHRGVATVVWGYGASEMRCVVTPPQPEQTGGK